MIPHIIHYCWLSDDLIPNEFLVNLNTWQQILSDYKFIKWDKKKFDIESNNWVKEAYQNKKYAFACDYIRLYALYTYGGIYLDMDIEVIKSFNDLLASTDLLIAYENESKDSIEAGCIGASRNNAIIGKILEYYKDKHFVGEDGLFDTKPLPGIIYSVVKDSRYSGNIFPSTYFTNKSFETGEIYASNESYAIHHFSGSWLSKREKKWRDFTLRLYEQLGEKNAKNILSFPLFFAIGYIYQKGIVYSFKKLNSKIKKAILECLNQKD